MRQTYVEKTIGSPIGKDGYYSDAFYAPCLKDNTGGSAPDALDADQIRVHLCANGGYPVEAINRAIADALGAGELVEVECGYVVADDVGES